VKEKTAVVLENISTYFWAPGIIAHELAHLLTSKLFGVEVVSYTLFNRPESIMRESTGGEQVVHAPAESDLVSGAITLSPVVFNTSLSAISLCLIRPVTLPLSAPLNYVSATIGLWVSFTFLFGAFPSGGDLENVGLEPNKYLIYIYSFLYPLVYLGLMFVVGNVVW
jgi:hypothetical protein